MPITTVEVRKAVATMARKKAAGDDGLVAELFQNLPCTIPVMLKMFNLVLFKGRIPHQLLRVVMVPLDKPHRDPEQCKSKRPISLISVMAKILEAVVMHRMMATLEPHLDPGRHRDPSSHFMTFLAFLYCD